MRTNEQKAIRLILRNREDMQAIRKSNNNRIGRKKDKKEQNIEPRDILPEDMDFLRKQADMMEKEEKESEKYLEKILKKIPVYNSFLKNVKGVGPVSAAWLIGEFDIHKATTVSKMWQYAGLNPGLVPGKKRVKSKSYNPEMGEIVGEISTIKDPKNPDLIVKTADMVPADRPSEGYILPYNKNLRTHLIGVLATNFIKTQNSYALEFYYPRKQRQENSSHLVQTSGRKRVNTGKPWGEVSKGHRQNDALRYMVKMFLIDFHKAWRECEGLEVRPPYHQEKLGHKHG
jgi:hypothetical protein